MNVPSLREKREKAEEEQVSKYSVVSTGVQC